MRIRTLVVVAATMLVSIALVPPAEAAAGAEHWIARFPRPGYSVDQVAGIAVAPDGSRLFVTGSVAHFTVYRADSGERLWGSFLDGGKPSVLGVNPTGSDIYVSSINGIDFTTVAYSTS